MRRFLGKSVLDAAKERIAFVFDRFARVYVSFSGGKDSTVMLHLVMDEAIRRGVVVGLLFVDLEGQYKLTIEHIKALCDKYAPNIDPYWICLPLNLRNAVSQFEPQWCCWEPGRERDWIRRPPAGSIVDQSAFPFYRYRMEFEEFAPEFGHWFSRGESCACFVGIRTQESLNRWRTIASGRKQSYDGKCWTTWCGQTLFNAYPIYDWSTEDLWTYHAQNKDLEHNKLYDHMHAAGLTIHQMRICQPYGDDQRKGLWLFHVVEPETWGRVVARVSGANQGALYARETGNILGRIKITKPDGHTWESFSRMLLDSMPPKTKLHFENKIAVFTKWWMDRGYPGGIPDDGPLDKSQPSWARVCKSLLRNDYWCKGLSFTQHKTGAYDKYLKVMKKRRQKWGI